MSRGHDRPVMDARSRDLASRPPLFAGIVAAGLLAQGVGLETDNVAIAFAVVAVGVFLGVGLGKVRLRR